MKNTGTLNVTTPTEREIVMTRVFDAPRSLVGPPGWSLPVCEVDLKVGGTSRFVWLSAIMLFDGSMITLLDGLGTLKEKDL